LRCVDVVRICLAIALLVGTSGSVASACPPLGACAVAPEMPEPAAAAIDAKVPPPKRAAPGEVVMPWIWETLRERVYSRMPKYSERSDKTDKGGLEIVLSPVVVKSPADTVPGIGIAGEF
jgi:hypothetical protein